MTGRPEILLGRGEVLLKFYRPRLKASTKGLAARQRRFAGAGSKDAAAESRFKAKAEEKRYG